MADDAKQQQGPRETAAGLQQGSEDPSVVRGGGPAEGEVNPASQSNMVDDRSTPDEQSTRAKSQNDDKVTADKWNQ